MEDVKSYTEKILMELTEQELTRFWKKLGSIETKHECKHIPYGRLEQAIKSGDSAGELSHLMVGHYERKAIDVLKDTLDEIGRKDQAKKVEDNEEIGKHYKKIKIDHSSQFKEEIKRKLKKIREYNSLPMERVDFSARFTKLTLVKKHQQQEDKKNELKAKGKEHTELMKKHRNMSIDIENLFTLVDEEKEEKQKTEPKTVVIQGPAGIGKSFTIHKIMLDWASGELFHDRFQYVFQLRCRELRIHKNDSLDDLILKCSRNLKPALEDILSKPEQVLFIFDGFDELSAGWTDNMNEEDVTSTTVMELLSRNIMPQASLLITTRPTALQALDNIVVIDRYIEIVGFLEDEIKEYFIKSFEDQEKALSAFNIIKGNKVVLSLCFLPIMCWIVCSMMKQALQPGEDIMKNMKTNTQVLIHFVNKLLEHHCRTSEKTEFLKIVSSLAFTGIKEEKLVFKNKDLKKFSINPTGNESPFFGKLFYKTDMDAKSVFHFMHLSIQELFAAMHCVSQSSTEEAVQLLNDSLHRDNLIDVVRFLFGLTDVKSQKIIEDFEMLSPALLKTCLLNWIPEAAASYKKQSPFFLQLLHCLYEIQDPQFAKTAMTTLSNIKLVNRPLSSIDCAVIKYCIEQSDSIQCLDIDIILVEEQVKILWDILPKCQFVSLHAGNITEDTFQLISRMLASQQCQQVKLNISKDNDELDLSIETRTMQDHSSSFHYSLEADKITEDSVQLICRMFTSEQYHVMERNICGKKNRFTEFCWSQYQPAQGKGQEQILVRMPTHCRLTLLNITEGTLQLIYGIFVSRVYQQMELCIDQREGIFNLSLEAGYKEKKSSIKLIMVPEALMLQFLNDLIPKYKFAEIWISGELIETAVSSLCEMLRAGNFTLYYVRIETTFLEEQLPSFLCHLLKIVTKTRYIEWKLLRGHEKYNQLQYEAHSFKLRNPYDKLEDCDGDEVDTQLERYNEIYSEDDNRTLHRLSTSQVSASIVTSICKEIIPKCKPIDINLLGWMNAETMNSILEMLLAQSYKPMDLRLQIPRMFLFTFSQVDNRSWELVPLADTISNQENNCADSRLGICGYINNVRIITNIGELIKKYKPNVIDLHGELGRNTAVHLSDILINKDCTPKNVSVTVFKNVTEPSEKSRCTIESEEQNADNVEWSVFKKFLLLTKGLKVDCEINKSKTRFSISNVSQSKVINILKMILPKCNPTDMTLSVGVTIVNHITELLAYNPRSLRVHISLENVASLEDHVHVLSVYNKMCWNVTFLGEKGCELEYKAENPNSSFSIKNGSESNTIPICRIIIPKCKPTNIDITGDLNEKDVHSVIEIIKEANYSPNILRICSWPQSEHVFDENSYITLSAEKRPKVTLEWIQSLKDEFNFQDLIDNSDGLCGSQLSGQTNETSIENMKEMKPKVTVEWNQSEPNDLSCEDLFELSDDVDGSQLSFLFTPISQSNVIDTCQQVIKKYKPKDIDLFSNFNNMTVESIINILSNEDCTPESIRFKINVPSESTVVDLCDILTSHFATENVTLELELNLDLSSGSCTFEKYKNENSDTRLLLVDVDEADAKKIFRMVIPKNKPKNIDLHGNFCEETVKFFIETLKSEDYVPSCLSIASKKIDNSTIEIMGSMLISEEKMKNLNWTLSNNSYYNYYDNCYTSLHYGPEESERRFSVHTSSDPNLKQLCEVIIPKYKPTIIDLCYEVGEETVKKIIEIIKTENYTPNHIRFAMYKLDDNSAVNICKRLASESKIKKMSWELLKKDFRYDSYITKKWISLKYEDGSSEASFSLDGVNECSALEISKIVISAYKPTNINLLRALKEKTIEAVVEILKNEDYTPRLLRIKSTVLTKTSAENINTILSSYNKMEIVSKPEQQEY